MSNYEVLNTAFAFQNVINHGKKIVCRSCIIFILKDNTLLKPHFGWIVSSKNGNAVIRNKIKRRLRIISLNLVDELKLKNSFAICYIAKKQAFLLDFSVIKHEIVNNVKKSIELYCESNK